MTEIQRILDRLERHANAGPALMSYSREDAMRLVNHIAGLRGDPPPAVDPDDRIRDGGPPLKIVTRPNGRAYWERETEPRVSQVENACYMPGFVIGEPLPCVNHPERKARTLLDHDALCQECADAWVRGERDEEAARILKHGRPWRSGRSYFGEAGYLSFEDKPPK